MPDDHAPQAPGHGDDDDAALAGQVFTVQLPAAERRQRAFLRQLQAALGPQATLGSLPPGPSADVFVIPGQTEQLLRARLAIADDDTFAATLRQWGALTVNQLQAPALFALMYRGLAQAPGGPAPRAKLSRMAAQPRQRAAAASALPRNFRGPHDWHLGPRGANVVAAWDLFAQAPAHADRLPWQDLRIGHIDTGYTEHAALGWAGGHSATVDVRRGTDYWAPQDPDPRDDWEPGNPGHGTRISAAFAGYLTRDAARPFYGVAPGVQVVPYRVTDSVIVDHVADKIAAALHEAIADGCHVVNISLGALRGDGRVARALDLAYESGVIVCCAAGQVWPWVIHPGRFNRCITMGGVGPDFVPWASAATGRHVDLCGPADQIRRVQPERRPPGDAAQDIAPVADGDGTSYATATCSGIAALWLAWHGVAALQARYASQGLWQIPAAFKRLARDTATPGAWPAGSGRYGSGVVNAAALLQAALPQAGSLRMAQPADAGFDPED